LKPLRNKTFKRCVAVHDRLANSVLATFTPKWWEVLGVDVRASDEEIRESYRKLARQHHPDNGGFADRMAEINRAYEQAKQAGNKCGDYKY
jgi:DnaJ-class molecular chaperone